MGGEGSGRRPDPMTVVARALSQGLPETTPINNNSIMIPNLSGVQDAAKKGAGSADLTKIHTQNTDTGTSNGWTFTSTAVTTYDNSSADTAYVPMVLYNTDATPPAANTVPIGTIYIQYTA